MTIIRIPYWARLSGICKLMLLLILLPLDLNTIRIAALMRTAGRLGFDFKIGSSYSFRKSRSCSGVQQYDRLHY